MWATSFSEEQLAALTATCMGCAEEILTDLDMDVRQHNNALVGPCALHGSNNNHSFILYLTAKYSDDATGIWNCFTNSCHLDQEIGQGFLNLVKALLHNKCGRIPHNHEVIKYLEGHVGKGWRHVADVQYSSTKRALTDFQRTTRLHQSAPLGIPRDRVRASLHIPAEYYLKRGYSAAVLQDYDVGLCTNPAKPFYSRIVFPVYDASGERMIGATARSIYEKCPKCKGFHSSGVCKDYSKWLHSSGFNPRNEFYNWWVAAPLARSTGKLVLVESPGNVLRLVESGVKNCAAVFGTCLNSIQTRLLEESGVTSVTLVFDNDPPDQQGKRAGLEGMLKAKRILERSYKVNLVNFLDHEALRRYNDVACLSVEQIRHNLIDLL